MQRCFYKVSGSHLASRNDRAEEVVARVTASRGRHAWGNSISEAHNNLKLEIRRIVMKHNFARIGFALVFAVAWMAGVATPVHADDQSCSLSGAAGTYGVSDSGTIIGIGPRAAVAQLTLDAEGNIKGKVTASLNGSVSKATLSGTYTVKSSCTGTTAFGEYDPSGKLLLTATVALVWDADMREFRFLFTSVALPDGTTLATVINGDAKKQ